MGFWETLGAAAQFVGRVAPQCHICGAPGAQICAECQQVGCHRHSYSNIGSAKSICSACLSKTYSWAAQDLVEAVPVDWPYDQMPWELLGVEPNATQEQVNKAHREASRFCHPDHDGDTQQQVALNRAREFMLNVARAA